MAPFTQPGPLIGDIINRVRVQVPDPAPTLVTPASTVSVVGVSGSTLPVGTYYAVVTQLNPWGEAEPTGESTALVIGVNQGILVASPLLPGCIAVRCYLTLAGGGSGNQQVFSESDTSPFTISTPPDHSGVPPQQSTASLPDSDGNMFSAAAMYGWLNDGLMELSRIVGGVQDYCGVPTASGQPLYTLPGQWLEISDVWYGGYWVQGGARRDFYRRNTVQTQILQSVSISVMSGKQVMEVSYQPDRASGVTALTSPLSATATAAAIGSSSVFLLPFGFAMLGTGVNTEIVAYANLAGTTMPGLVRGLGNTFAQDWPTSTTVTELSLFWCGKRLMTTKFSPGNSVVPLPVPGGWETILPIYMLAQAKTSEQDMQGRQALLQEFQQKATQWLESSKKPPSFLQVGGSNRTVSYDNTVAGGIVIPL